MREQMDTRDPSIYTAFSYWMVAPTPLSREVASKCRSPFPVFLHGTGLSEPHSPLPSTLLSPVLPTFSSSVFGPSVDNASFRKI
ncbi:hypothetical protein KCU61_g228, partial [Aureobasidium melanogenum]